PRDLGRLRGLVLLRPLHVVPRGVGGGEGGEARGGDESGAGEPEGAEPDGGAAVDDGGPERATLSGRRRAIARLVDLIDLFEAHKFPSALPRRAETTSFTLATSVTFAREPPASMILPRLPREKRSVTGAPQIPGCR